MEINRRDFVRLTGIAGVVFASGLGAGATLGKPRPRNDDFYFVQLSDTHWGFDGPAVNPDAKGTLRKAVTAINGLEQQPDFVVFTGDLTHTTDNATTRRDRMKEFRDIVSELRVKDVRFMPGEHDAALDRGEAYQEFFGKLYYTFDHKGVHFIVLDNVSDPNAVIGDAQLAWLKANLARKRDDSPVVVLTHRPLFDLYPSWDWATRDGQATIDVLMPHKNVTVFYGHIHQEHHHMTGHIAHHSAKSLMFPLPAPGSVPTKKPVPWDTSHPYNGLGFRSIEAGAKRTDPEIVEYPVLTS